MAQSKKSRQKHRKENKSKRCAATTERNDLDSPLLRLPLELRDQIYAYVLTTTQPHIFTCTKPTAVVNGTTTSLKSIMSRAARRDFALLSVCRRIHAEASLLPYSLNTIRCVSLQTLAQLPTLLTPAQRGTFQSLHLVTALGQRRKLIKILNADDAWHSTFEALLPGVRKVVVELGEYPYMHTQEQVKWYKEDLGKWIKGEDRDEVEVSWEGDWEFDWNDLAEL